MGYLLFPVCSIGWLVSRLQRWRRKNLMNSSARNTLLLMRHKCRRTVLPHWSKNRPWLRVESTVEHDIMFCDYCVKADVSGDKCNFVRGCTSMWLESITCHEGTNMHYLASQKYKNEMQPSEAPTMKACQSLNKALFTKLQHLFHNIHALNVQARPFSDYVWMNELDEQKGLQLGEMYRMAYCCIIFLPINHYTGNSTTNALVEVWVIIQTLQVFHQKVSSLPMIIASDSRSFQSSWICYKCY